MVNKVINYCYDYYLCYYNTIILFVYAEPPRYLLVRRVHGDLLAFEARVLVNANQPRCCKHVMIGQWLSTFRNGNDG